MSNYVIEESYRMTQRIDYPDAVGIEFESLDDYIKIAKKLISTYAPRHSRGVMLRSDDAISYVAERIMRADWQFKPEISTDRRAYRRKSAVRAIFECVRLFRNSGTIRVKVNNELVRVPASSLEDRDDGVVIGETVEDLNALDPLAVMVRADNLREAYHHIGNMPSPVQECMVLKYVMGYSYADAAKSLGVSRSAVQKSVKRGLRIIKDKMDA